VRLQVPTPTKLTTEPFTVQTDDVEEVVENTVPSPEVAIVGEKALPFFDEAGMFVIVIVGVA
jgi:hypothetical protein